MSEEAFTFRHYSRVAQYEGLNEEDSCKLQKVEVNKSIYSNASDKTGLNRIPKLFNVFYNFHVRLYQIIYHSANIRILFFSYTSNKREAFLV